MLQSYLRIALRSLRKRFAYAAINITGLAVGMACAVLIFLSVRHDLSFDRFHGDADRIYRVLTIDRALGLTSNNVGITMPPLGPTAEAELPEVEKAVRMNNQGRQLMRYGDKSLYVENTYLSESAIFEVFDFELVAGNPETALSRPATVVLTEETARRIFGDEDPIGKVLNEDQQFPLTVTGIVAAPPANSHLQFGALLSLVPSDEQQGFQQFLTNWGSIAMITYVRVRPGTDAEALIGKLEQLIRANDVSENFSVTLQPLLDVHLRSSDILFDSSAHKGDMGYVLGLGAVAVFILVIACFNFMNLATARSAERAKEVGVRKVVGATRKQLIVQHMSESIVLCLLAFVLAVALVALVLPLAQNVFGRAIAFDLFSDPGLLLFLVLLAVGVALVSGSYPAFVLSRFAPARVLKGTFKTGKQGQRLRRVLVVTQFTASLVMIVGALIVSDQLGYIMKKNMGYNRDQVVVLEMFGPALQQQLPTFRDELLQNPSIKQATRSGSLPGRQFGRTGIQPEGASEEDTWIVNIMAGDDKFIPTLGMEMAAGRNYSEEYGTDQQEAIIINEAAARALGWSDPIGKQINAAGGDREVIGVVKDFNFASVRHQVEPLVMLYNPNAGGLLSLKLDTANLPETLRFIEQTWQRVYPNNPFEYSFLDADFAEQYQEERTFATMAKAFTGIAILIACLGLFGLASFTIQQRTKEIGIRKTLGASVHGIVFLLSKDFLKLVLVAFAIATPIAYFTMNDWLSDFAYRIEIGPLVFIVAAVLAVLVAFGTVSYQAIRAARTNPATALRYE